MLKHAHISSSASKGAGRKIVAEAQADLEPHQTMTVLVGWHWLDGGIMLRGRMTVERP